MSNAQDNVFLAFVVAVALSICAAIYFLDTKPFIERCETLGGEMIYTATSKTKVCEVEIGNLFKAER